MQLTKEQAIKEHRKIMHINVMNVRYNGQCLKIQVW